MKFSRASLFMLFQVALILVKLFGLLDLTWLQVFYPILIILAPVALSVVCTIILSVVGIILTLSVLTSLALFAAFVDFNIGD